ncbi:MAG TPA: hypothetical protein VJC12_00920 [Candidatus Paceibacterota bacterium]
MKKETNFSFKEGYMTRKYSNPDQSTLPGETELERRRRLGIPIPPIPDPVYIGNGVTTRIIPDWMVPVAPPLSELLKELKEKKR